jgi:DNA-binding XRE family transcriptional regulator
MSSKKIVTDAYRWSYDRYVKDDPELVEFAKDIRVKAELAQQIYDIRNKLHMTRDDLAGFSGLTPESIEDIEETDYDGDWDGAVALINRAFRVWVSDVIVPVARMTPDDYSAQADRKDWAILAAAPVAVRANRQSRWVA